MGEHATESNSLSGKSLPHVNELSLSLRANKFCPISLQPSFNPFIFFELDVEENLWFSHFLSLLVLFPMKNNGCLLFLSHAYVMDVLYPLNQTPLGFPSVLMTLECI